MTFFNHFDFLAPLYDRLIKTTDPTKMRSQANLPISGILLDVGGGTGRSSVELRKLVRSIVIVDSSVAMLHQAKKKSCFITICSQSEELPFLDESFERVIMVDALHHVKDFQFTIDELWRVVKPGGRIVIEEPDIRTVTVKILALIEKLALMRSHLISPIRIRESFNFPNARGYIEREGNTAWVIIDKLVINN